MGYASQQDALRARVAAASPVASIAWDGMRGPSFTPPPFDASSPSTAAIWIRPSLSGALVDPFGFGSGLLWDRKTGVATIQVFVPKGLSADLCEPVLESCMAIFRNRTVGGVRFGPSSMPNEIVSEGKPFRQFNITSGYVLDEAFEEAA